MNSRAALAGDRVTGQLAVASGSREIVSTRLLPQAVPYRHSHDDVNLRWRPGFRPRFFIGCSLTSDDRSTASCRDTRCRERAIFD